MHAWMRPGSLLLLALAMVTARAGDDVALARLIEGYTSHSPARTQPLVDPDGSEAVALGGGFQQAWVAQVDDEGAMRSACVASVTQASRFFGRDLWTGARLPTVPAAAAVAHDMSALDGLTPEEYAVYWAMIESADSRPQAVAGSTITIVNADAAGEGFNDPTTAVPEGGNPGSTRGQQRLNVFNHAAGIWAGFLDSQVPIRIQARFDPLTPCTPSGGVLGAAGPTTVHALSGGHAPFDNTWYVAAQADKLKGADQSPANPDIVATFNSNIDAGCLGAGTRFYYGLDNATPSGRINLLVVVLHEIGHGLGFLSLTDEDSGELFNGKPDVWAHFMYDRSRGKLWADMTNAQRAASATNAGNLLWDGPNVRLASSFLTAGREAATGRVELYAPTTLEPGSSVSHWGKVAFPNLLMEPVINAGLPLSLDLGRQLSRDIGWFRDADGNGSPDLIGNVQPSGGTVVAGSTTTIRWNNPPGFARKVSIELSTDGGTRFPIGIASNIDNSGSYLWQVPNLTTSQARIRVREHDFIAPAGISASNFTIGSGNTPPIFTPAVAVTRQQGSAAGAALVVGTVSDAQTPAGNLTVTQVAGGSAAGIAVSGIGNTNGVISAQLAANCLATPGTLRFRVSDGSLSATGDLQVNIEANTPPILEYSDASVAGGAGVVLAPDTGPSDNGSVSGILLQSRGTYTGGIDVNSSTGVITFANAAPLGTHTLVVRATDNCGATRQASFQLSVENTAPVFLPAAPLTRQQGSPAGAPVQIGVVSDGQSAAGSLGVTLIPGGSASGISVTDIGNANGTITARLAASCTASAGTLRFEVSDGALASSGELQVEIEANTPPLLAYADAGVAAGSGLRIWPSAGPVDNGALAGIVLQSAGSYSGDIDVDPANGVITLAHAAPVGIHVITLRASDTCGATRDASLHLDVDARGIFGDGFE